MQRGSGAAGNRRRAISVPDAGDGHRHLSLRYRRATEAIGNDPKLALTTHSTETRHDRRT
jgi:hypothetical protein